MCIESTQFTAVNAGIYRLLVSMGNQFSTDYSAMVGPILIISTVHPMKGLASYSVDTCVQKTHCGLFLPKYASFFRAFFPFLQTSGQNIQNPTNRLKIFFLLGDTACWISCAAQFPHCNSEPVDGPLKMPQINEAKQQCIDLSSLSL